MAKKATKVPTIEQAIAAAIKTTEPKNTIVDQVMEELGLGYGTVNGNYPDEILARAVRAQVVKAVEATV